MAIYSTLLSYMARIIDYPQDMWSEISTGNTIQNVDKKQITSASFGSIRNNITQGMGIGNSHGEENLLGKFHKVWILAIHMVNKFC